MELRRGAGPFAVAHRDDDDLQIIPDDLNCDLGLDLKSGLLQFQAVKGLLCKGPVPGEDILEIRAMRPFEEDVDDMIAKTVQAGQGTLITGGEPIPDDMVGTFCKGGEHPVCICRRIGSIPIQHQDIGIVYQ